MRFSFDNDKWQTKNEGLYNYPFDIVCHFFYLSNNQLILSIYQPNFGINELPEMFKPMFKPRRTTARKREIHLQNSRP